MHWLYEWRRVSLDRNEEPLVDCRTCKVQESLGGELGYSAEKKCCEFSPWLSTFALGAFLEKNPQWAPSFGFKNFCWSWMGVNHPLSKRNGSKSLCQFFDSSLGSCEVWEVRPATCFSFYCASSKGKNFYENREGSHLAWEAFLVEPWYDYLGGSQEGWSLFCEYMDPHPSRELPQWMCFDHWEEAKKSYVRSWNWLIKNPNLLDGP